MFIALDSGLYNFEASFAGSGGSYFRVGLVLKFKSGCIFRILFTFEIEKVDAN